MGSVAAAAPARRSRLVLLVLWVVFYGSFTLFSPPLLDDADSVHAEVARQMLLRHDYVTLYANGIRYLEKAPLYYWSMAASMKVFGATTAASRVPLALAVLGLALGLEWFGRRGFASARAGLYAGLITLSSFGIFIFSRINIPDVLVCLWLTVALGCYWRGEQEERPGVMVCCGFAAALALNVLTKGLIGVVFPLAIAGTHLLLTRGWGGALRRLRVLHALPALGTFLVIAAPWHVLIALANPGHGHPGGLAHVNGHWVVPYPTDGNVHGWAWFYFVNEQLYRYLNLRVPHDYDTSPLWLFLGLILVWLMPWSAWLPAAVARAWSSGRRGLRQGTQRLTGEASLNVLLLLWLSVPLAFFLLSTRQEYYVLPALPPMMLLIAGCLARGSGRSAAWIARLLLIVGAVLSLSCVVLLLGSHRPAGTTDLAMLLTQNPADYALSFGHVLDLTGPALSFFRLPLGLAAAAFLCGPLANYLLRRRARAHTATLALAAASFVFLLASWLGLRTFSPTLTSYQLAQAIAPQLHAQDLLAIHGEYEAGSTLGFYLRRTDIHILEGRSSNLWYGSFFPDAPAIFETRATLAGRWTGAQRIFLWQDPHDSERPALTERELGGPVYVVADAGGKQMLSNQPDRR